MYDSSSHGFAWLGLVFEELRKLPRSRLSRSNSSPSLLDSSYLRVGCLASLTDFVFPSARLRDAPRLPGMSRSQSFCTSPQEATCRRLEDKNSTNGALRQQYSWMAADPPQAHEHFRGSPATVLLLTPLFDNPAFLVRPGVRVLVPVLPPQGSQTLRHAEHRRCSFSAPGNLQLDFRL